MPTAPAKVAAFPNLAALPPYETLVAHCDDYDAYACYVVGRMWETGMGTPDGKPDWSRAIVFYQNALNMRSLNGIFHLGDMKVRTSHWRTWTTGWQATEREGREDMKFAMDHGYDPAIDAPALRPLTKSEQDTLDMEKGFVALVGVAAVVITAAAVSDNQSTSSKTPQSNYQWKSCVIPYDELVYDSTGHSHTESHTRVGYAWQCP